VAAELSLDPKGDWTDRLVTQPRGRSLDVLNTAQLCVVAASVKRFEALTGQKFALLVLDPLSNIHSGEEDKRDSMAPVMARLHALEAYLDLAVVFVHHSGKDSADNKGRKRGGQKMRGSSAIHAAVDFGLYFSNLRGDGKTEFIALVESEMKAARGAGKFDRSLKITDNEKGNAVRAAFAWSEPAAGEAAEASDGKAFDLTLTLFQHGAPLTRDELRRKVKGSTDAIARGLVEAEEDGWITQRFVGQRPAGYEITELGREIVRDGRSGSGGADPAGPQTPPKDKAGGFIASCLPEQN
jgi:hypothetical protein